MMKKLHYMLLALLLCAVSCAESGGTAGGENPDVPQLNVVEIASLPGEISFDANFEAGDELSFDLVVDAQDYTIPVGAITTVPASSPYYTVDVESGDAKNEFAVTLTASEAAAKLLVRTVEKVQLSVQYAEQLDALLSDEVEIIFPEVTNAPAFESQPADTVLFAPYFEVGDVSTTEVEVNLAGASVDDIVFSTYMPNDKFTLSAEPITTTDPALFAVKFTATEAAIKAVEAARLDPVAAKQNSIVNYINLTLARDGMDDKYITKSRLFRVVYVMDDTAPAFTDSIPAAEFLMNFRTDTTAVSTFVIDPGTKAIDAESFTAEANDYVTVAFEAGEAENEFRAIFTPTELAVADTAAFSTECEISINYDDSLSVSSNFTVNFAADVEMLPSLIGEIGSVTYLRDYKVGTSLELEFEIHPGSYVVDASNLIVADNNYFSTTIVEGEEANHYVMTIAAKQGALDLSATLGAEKEIPGAVMLSLNGNIELFGMFGVVLPPSITLDMKMMSVASTAFVYRVEIGGLEDTDIVNKGVARTQDSTLNITSWAKWKHGATNLAYIGIRDKLTPGGTYRMCPFVELADGSIAYGDVQIVKTYASANDVPRIGKTTWYWDNPWFKAEPGNKNHKPSDPTSATDPAAISKKAIIEARMDSACYYYSVYCKRAKNISVMYKTSVGTANSTVGSNHINFGHSFGWSTALHEISHSMGTGGNKFGKLFVNKVYVGKNASKMLQEMENSRTAQIKGDGTHFWPYNMNYSTEYNSEADAIRHVMIMQAIINDGM